MSCSDLAAGSLKQTPLLGLMGIRIRLAEGRGYQFFYRRSYYADAGMAARHGAARGSREAFLEAMRRGVPPSSQIIFKTRLVGAGKKPPSGPIAGAVKKMKHRAARYTVKYAVLLNLLHLTPHAGGSRTGRLEAFAIAYGRHGRPLNWVETEVPISRDRAEWNRYKGYRMRSGANCPQRRRAITPGQSG